MRPAPLRPRHFEPSFLNMHRLSLIALVAAALLAASCAAAPEGREDHATVLVPLYPNGPLVTRPVAELMALTRGPGVPGWL